MALEIPGRPRVCGALSYNFIGEQTKTISGMASPLLFNGSVVKRGCSPRGTGACQPLAIPGETPVPVAGTGPGRTDSRLHACCVPCAAANLPRAAYVPAHGPRRPRARFLLLLSTTRMKQRGCVRALTGHMGS